MVCNRCGKEVLENTSYCPYCFNTLTVNNSQSYNSYQQQSTSNMQFNNSYAQQTTYLNNNNPVMHTNLNQNSTNNKVMNTKKNNTWIYMVCAIVVAIIIFSIIIIKTNNPDDIIKNKESNITSNTSNINNTIKTIKFKSYVFTIPSDYITSISDKNQLQVVSNNSQEVYVYDVQTGSYDALKRNKNSIIEQFEKQNYKANNILVRTYNGLEFLTVEITDSTMSYILAYYKLSQTDVAIAVIGNSTYTVDYNLMDKVADIFKNVTHE